MGEVHVPRHPGLGQCFSRYGEVPIFVVQVDAILRFPICEEFQELCRYYPIVPAQLVPKAIKMCDDFKIMCIHHEGTCSLPYFAFLVVSIDSLCVSTIIITFKLVEPTFGVLP